MKLQQEVDEFSDPYYWDLDLADLKQLLNNIQRSENSKAIDYYREKYCPNDRWSLFHRCSVYFYCSSQSLKADWQVLLKLTQRRLKLEVLMGGGKISENLKDATHVVVLSRPGLDVDFDSLIKSCSLAEKNLLWKKGLHVVGSQWLESCLEQRHKLQEDQYSLKPDDVEETSFFECKLDQDPKEIVPDVNSGQNQVTSTSHGSTTEQRAGKDHMERSVSLVTPGYGNRKRKLASNNKKKGKAVVSRAPRVPRRRGKMSVKIIEDESGESGSDDKTNKETEKDEENTDNVMVGPGSENFEFHQNQVAEENAGIKWPDKVSDTVMRETNNEHASIIWPDKTSDTVMYETDNDQGGKKAEEFNSMELDKENRRHETSKSEKSEVMSDPVQAMLLDMIPSLGKKHVETSNSVVQNVDNDAKIPVVEDDKLDADIIAPPPKKKKVSYKDVAGELLKDW